MFYVLLFMFVSVQMKAQEVKVRSTFDVSIDEIMSSYGLNFGLDIPISKSLEISPEYAVLASTHSQAKPHYSYNMYITFKPFQLSKNENLNKIDFGIGTGLGLKTTLAYNEFTQDARQRVQYPLVLIKTYYNYHYKNNFVGLVLEMYELEEFFMGVQFGFEIPSRNK